MLKHSTQPIRKLDINEFRLDSDRFQSMADREGLSSSEQEQRVLTNLYLLEELKKQRDSR